MAVLTLDEIAAKTTYKSRDEIEIDLQEFAKANGFVVTLDSGGNLDPRKGTVKAYFKCIHGGFYRPHREVNDINTDENVSDADGR